MKKLDDCISEIKRMSEQIEELEKLVKLLLINSLVDEAAKQEMHLSYQLDENVISVFGKYNLKVTKQEIIEGSKILYVGVSSGAGIKNIKHVHDLFKVSHSDITLVFQFGKINGMQKKRLIEEKISFYVVDKELYIFALRGN